MPFEAAKCPNCGAAIQVPGEMTQARCMYCGSTLLVREAIQKLKVELSGQVNVAGLSSVDNDLERARQSMAVRDFAHAYRYYCSAVDKQANSYAAWRGCLLAATENLAAADLAQYRLDGLMGLKSLVDNCIHYVPREQKPALIQELTLWRDQIMNLARQEAQPKKKAAERALHEQAKGSIIAGGIFGAIGWGCQDPAVSGAIRSFLDLKPTPALTIASWIFFGFAGLGILSAWKIFKRVDIQPLLDPQKLALANHLDGVIRAANLA